MRCRRLPIGRPVGAMVVLPLLVFAFAAVRVEAQTPGQTEAREDGAAGGGARPWTVGPYFGTSQHSPVGHRWGLTPDRKHYFIGIHADVPLFQNARWAFSWAPELTPLLVVTNNPQYRRETSPDTGREIAVEDGRSPVVGAGLAPIGFEADVAIRPRLQTYAAGALGCLWFTRQAPVLDSRVFNFTFEFGGGLRVRLDEQTWMRAGYKFHHFSNAHTARQNPGVDAEVFFLGFERQFSRRPRVPQRDVAR